MDEKNSQDSTPSNVENTSGTAESAPPASAPIPAPLPPFKTSPATLPFQARASLAATPSPLPSNPGSTAAKFELAPLIKLLPEASHAAALAQSKIVPPPQPVQFTQPPPAIIPPVQTIVPAHPTAPAPILPAVTAPPAPNFTPFVAPSTRLESSARLESSTGLEPRAPIPASPPHVQAPAATAPPQTLLKRLTHYSAQAARFAAIAFAAWFVTVMVLIAAFRLINPPQSMLMLTQRLGGQPLQHEWVPLEQMSTNLRRAVIASEDSKFCRHWGFDLGEIRAAMRSTEGYGRGASTITQQLSKNLFLWNGKSYIRKALEVPLTLAIEALWSKKRILEVYLNVAEWGPGVFGAEAAAQYYYNKPASQLSERESALLAVSLPNPIARDASDPNPAIARRASTLQARMRVQGISYCALTPKKN